MPLVSLSSNALEVLSVDRIGEQYLVVQDTVTLIRMGASPFFSSLVFRMKNRMFIVPCFIFVSFKCCTFGWLAKHEWEQPKAFFLCCLGIRWEAQNYYFGFRDDTGKTLMFSEVWNNRWFLMRLKKTPNQPCVICLQFRFLACRQQIKIRWNDCVSADFLIFHFLKVVPPGIVLYLQVAVYHHFSEKEKG